MIFMNLRANSRLKICHKNQKYYLDLKAKWSRFYYIIYKGIRLVKQYSYPIIEWGCRNLSDLFKFYQKNQCVESRFYYIIYKGIRSVKQYGYPIIEWGCQNLSDFFKFYQKNQCVENSIEILSQNLMRESNALQNTIEISNASLYRWGGGGGVKNFYRKTDAFFHFYRKTNAFQNRISLH